jgi:hypothetical protein
MAITRINNPLSKIIRNFLSFGDMPSPWVRNRNNYINK